MQAIFDYILTLLNDNTDGLEYRGNYIFKFYEEKMTVLEAVSGKLVSDEIDITPVSILTKVPIPFVESNRRIDWMLELGFLVRIQGSEYDPLVDLDYANIKSVLDALQGNVVTNNNKRYAFKTQAPNYNGFSFLGKSKWAILTTTLNITELTFGYFGNDSVWTVDSTAVDVTQVTKTSVKSFYAANKKNDLTNDYNKAISRSVVIEMTFNYNAQTDLLSEVNGKQTLTKTYTVSETFNSGTAVTYTMIVESASEIQIKGTVKQLIVRFVEV